MDTTKLAVICCMFLIEVERCLPQFRGGRAATIIKLIIRLVVRGGGAMLLQDRDASIITIIGFIIF